MSSSGTGTACSGSLPCWCSSRSSWASCSSSSGSPVLGSVHSAPPSGARSSVGSPASARCGTRASALQPGRQPFREVGGGQASMTIGMISGVRRNARCAQRRDVAADHLLELVGVADALGGRAGQRLLDDLHGGLEVARRVLEAADQEVGRVGERAGVGVDDRQHGDHALLGERAAVLERGLGDPADDLAVDVHVARRDLAGDLRLALDQVDDDAVVGQDDAVGVDAGADREVGVGAQVAVLAVDRHDVARLHEVVAVDELTGAGVARDVHLGVALVDDVGAPAGEAVDDAGDGVLVAGDRPSWP